MNGIMLIRYLISKIRYLWDFLCFCKMLIPVRISPYPPLSQTWNEIQIMHWFSHSDSSCNGGIWNLAAAAAAKSLQSCPTLCNPIDGSPPGSPVPGFSRQEHWSGLPFPSPMQESGKWKWRHSVVTNLDSILKSRDITASTKVSIIKLWFFQLSGTDVRAGPSRRLVSKNWCFQIVVLKKTLESPLNCKEIKQY